MSVFCHQTKSILVEWPFNVKPSALSLTWNPESHPPTHAHPPTSTHPALVSPYVYLTALCAPSRSFMTVWVHQQRQIITSFFLSMAVKGSGSTDWADVESFWVSCLSTGWADADMTTSMWVFIANHSDQDPVWGVSTCVHTKLRVGSRNLDLDQQSNNDLFS